MGIVKATNLGKAFKHYQSRWHMLLDWLLPFGSQRYEQHWVLRNINFDIEAGEAVALIGMNGAGKSTLLKLISGTLKPTDGSIRVTGHLSALLELGIGFHPDLTGRQNVFMAGQLLGLSQAKIKKLMPDIEAFAEIGDYIDQPIRVYSSGMQVRLAFSIATAYRPDILVIDEALSVGDAHFQHKSFERIQKYREQGTALLIVSHDKNAILSICDRVILLNRGQQIQDGSPIEIFDLYNAIVAEADGNASQVQQKILDHGRTQTRSGSGEARVASISLLESTSGQVLEILRVGTRVRLEIDVAVLAPLPALVLGFSIRNRLGQIVFGTNTYHTQQILEDLQTGEVRKFCIEFFLNIGPGAYSISTALVNSNTHLDQNYEWVDNALSFDVVHGSETYFEGQSYLEPIIRIF